MALHFHRPFNQTYTTMAEPGNLPLRTHPDRKLVNHPSKITSHASKTYTSTGVMMP